MAKEPMAHQAVTL